MNPGPAVPGKHTIPAVVKAMDLLGMLAEDPGETSTKALALRLGIPRTTCYRILRSLIARDWVRPGNGGRHELSLGLLPVLAPLRQADALAHTLQPVLEELALQTRLTAKASVRQGDYAVTVARCESPQETSVAVRIGASFHLAYGSSGAVLLSPLAASELAAVLERAPAECWENQTPQEVANRLSQLDAQGWCSDMGTFRTSCHAVSAPVRGSVPRKVAAALTVIGFSHEVTNDRLASLGRAVLNAAQEASRSLARLQPRNPTPPSQGL